MKKALLYVLTIIGWLTFIVRLYLRIVESEFSVIESTIQFFSFFTILTNLLVTLYCTYLLTNSRSIKFLNKPEAINALTVFILIVGIVYHIALKPIWNPKGFIMLLSEIHHTLVPLGTLILWFLTTNKNEMKITRVLKWLLYPLIYIVFVLIRGNFSKFYPYPFLDANTIGLKKVVINSIFLLVFMVISLIIFYGLGQFLHKKKEAK